ncbi:hypothetical protein [Rhizobium wenxiniae]|uniref:hypothetical protein n=1 Tax=Rhizobium wenxiniae TaxID=1737357 RepID=UPI003C2660DD
MASDFRFLALFAATTVLLSSSVQAASDNQSSQLPDWLAANIGEANGQIALPVLQRARALYLSKIADGKVKNPCYFAMDATRPNDLTNGKSGGRFYTICEASQTFRVISSGHGSGRKLPGVADFSNGRECAKNFGNALDSNLTMGGAYLTSEIKTSFKGYYRNGSSQQSLLTRSFVQFDGIGETANARERAIGGHPATLVSGICMQKKPGSPYADDKGYVPLGTLINYSGGRSNGCTTWSPAEAPQVLSTIKDDPTTVYIYPESRDIEAISRTKGAGVYWNASCLKQIGTPRFWSRDKLEPLIAQYKKDHPAPPPKPIPICDVQLN